jgi:hypothetical protein
MARFGLGKVAIRGGALFAVGVSLLVACHGAESLSPSARAEREEDSNLPCAEDEVREYFCDDLLPLSSSRPAPEPYDNCPSTTDIRHGSFEPVAQIARFDLSYTAYTRRRVQPGHSCCYGWCAKVKVADAGQAAPMACRDSSGLRESFCMRELEGGTSTPSASPYGHCPVAVKPPEVVAFSAPSSALLDVAETSQRRRDLQLPECCYGWCSVPPAGTVLEASHPKIK